MFIQSFASLNASPASSRVGEFKHANGMQVVVVPDHRAPVVTHYVWYRVGSADEPPGVSGIAHFLEHLMFKSTDKIASGAFSKTVARLGGQDNAFTSHDVTGYFQRISKDRLKTVMEMEADRMVNLKLTEKEVADERPQRLVGAVEIGADNDAGDDHDDRALYDLSAARPVDLLELGPRLLDEAAALARLTATGLLRGGLLRRAHLSLALARTLLDRLRLELLAGRLRLGAAALAARLPRHYRVSR